MDIFDSAENGVLDEVQQFLEKGMDINTQNLGNGWTPLFYASKYGHVEIVRFLLEQGALLDSRSIGGLTALMLASRYEQFKIVKFLLEHGADPNLRTNNENTALGFAQFMDAHNVLFLFHKHSHLLEDEKKRLLQERKYCCNFQKALYN